MTLDQFTRDEGVVARQYEYDDGSVLAVDFGAEHPEASVDVADDTVIVVVESTDRSDDGSPEGDEQYELELPEGADDAHTFMKNGVLTIEVEGDL
ncbi:Hsp20/alpha crystallin family protein [Natronolimnohabitans sp. A-GB9]|uniref:Hsp20/alpha crystallin family protein n=1 Tax=Natronolimnohabitans sp. A-GB9 TaxID=3069757 RepID=UPI0027AFAFFD|nr:Hsp20/alpha crystallin family protein [Natronolimnohabitans sp. A-GB9]MDQ2051592.1 Hsp20/alpha crystallin family protein [Natronolimnohabitans sp. A-GB9]